MWFFKCFVVLYALEVICDIILHYFYTKEKHKLIFLILVKINFINDIITKRGEKMSNKFTVIIMILIILFSSIGFANSAEPPSLIIVVPSMADQVEITIAEQSDEFRNNKISKIFETYHQFYLYDLSKSDTLTVHVNTEGKSFNITIEEPLNRYRNTYTLDLENQILEKLMFGKGLLLHLKDLLLFRFLIE
jgi:hypothetical protein